MLHDLYRLNRRPQWIYARPIGALLVCATLLGLGSACSKKPTFAGAALNRLEGTVTLVPAGGAPYRVTEAMLFTPQGLLLEGDSVSTGSASRVDIQFPTGLVMRLGADSAVKLAKGKVLSGDNFSEVVMDLTKGRLMTRKQKLHQDSRVIVQTPTITASVRGTEFLVIAEPGSGEVLVQEGTVVVSGEPATRDVDAPDAPSEPDAESEIEIMDVDGTEVSEGTKIEINESGDGEDVAELDDEDRQELAEMSDGLDYMDAQGLQQIEQIMQSFEEAKAEIGAAVEEQRLKNDDLIRQERQRMRDEFESQKSQIRGEDDNLKNAQDKARSELDRIKNMQ
jgi:hypothetical protein